MKTTQRLDLAVVEPQNGSMWLWSNDTMVGCGCGPTTQWLDVAVVLPHNGWIWLSTKVNFSRCQPRQSQLEKVFLAPPQFPPPAHSFPRLSIFPLPLSRKMNRLTFHCYSQKFTLLFFLFITAVSPPTDHPLECVLTTGYGLRLDIVFHFLL